MSPWLRLIRFHRPIGFWLLLFATLIGLWVAAGGMPPFTTLLIFVSGTFVMRSAGCVINDLADRSIDSKVKRTQDRPLAEGSLTPKQAWTAFIFLSLIGLALALNLNAEALLAAVLAMPIIVIYPYSKRFLPCPQVVLAFAFAWPIIMAFMALQGELPIEGWVLFASHAFWIIGYDTLYAMADKPEDLKANIQSMATWLGSWDAPVVWIALFLAFLGQLWVGHNLAMPTLWHAVLTLWWALFTPFWWRIHQTRDPRLAFKGFRLNAALGIGTWLIWACFMLPGHGCSGIPCA